MLRWLWSTFTGANSDPRRMRQRGGVCLNDLALFVGRLIVLNASRVAGHHTRPQYRSNPFPITGFRQKSLRPTTRRAMGSWLRGMLRHRNPLTRVIILLHALINLEAYVFRIYSRIYRRLTRLSPRIVAAPPADTLVTLVVCAPCAADSS